MLQCCKRIKWLIHGRHSITFTLFLFLPQEQIQSSRLVWNIKGICSLILNTSERWKWLITILKLDGTLEKYLIQCPHFTKTEISLELKRHGQVTKLPSHNVPKENIGVLILGPTLFPQHYMTVPKQDSYFSFSPLLRTHQIHKLLPNVHFKETIYL